MVISLITSIARMSEKTTCPLCPKILNYSGLKKHMFSKNHLSIWNDPRSRGRLQECFDGKAKNTVQFKNIFLCFGCKTFTRQDVPHSCPNKQVALDFIKTILDVPARKPEVVAPEPKGPPFMASPNSPEVQTPVPKDVLKLQRNYDLLEKRNEMLEARCEKASDFLQLAQYFYNYIKNEDKDIFYAMISNAKEQGHEEAMSHLKN
jgi:hypothetical protein